LSLPSSIQRVRSGPFRRAGRAALSFCLAAAALAATGCESAGADIAMELAPGERRVVWLDPAHELIVDPPGVCSVTSLGTRIRVLTAVREGTARLEMRGPHGVRAVTLSVVAAALPPPGLPHDPVVAALPDRRPPLVPGMAPVPVPAHAPPAAAPAPPATVPAPDAAFERAVPHAEPPPDPDPDPGWPRSDVAIGRARAGSRDRLEPDGALSSPADAGPVPPVPPPLLGTIRSDLGTVALFRGRRARVGDRVGGYRVERIDGEGVWLIWNGHRYRMTVQGRPREEDPFPASDPDCAAPPREDPDDLLE
jgi:hypothetical protein